MPVVDCANCGTQTMITGPEDSCQFCGENASKKAAVVSETTENVLETTENVLKATKAVGEAVTRELRKPVPPKPKGMKKRAAYWDKHKEEIIADYQLMSLRDFFARWHISTNLWLELKKAWKVQGKQAEASVKKYVAVCFPWAQDQFLTATELTEVELSKWLKNGSIKDGDIVYEVVFKRVAKKPVMVLEPA